MLLCGLKVIINYNVNYVSDYHSLISLVVAATAEDEVDQVDVVDGAEVGAAGLVLPAVRVEVHVAERAEPRGRHGHASL